MVFFWQAAFICFFFQGIEMAKLLESHIKSDPNFEVPAKRLLGLVVFCLKVCDVNSTWSRGGLSVLFCYLDIKKEMIAFVMKPPSLYVIIIEMNDDYLQKSSLSWTNHPVTPCSKVNCSFDFIPLQFSRQKKPGLVIKTSKKVKLDQAS